MAASLNDNLSAGILYGNQENSLATILDSIEDTENEIKINYKSPYMDNANLQTFLEKNITNFTVLSTNIASINAKYDELVLFVENLKQSNLQFSAIIIQESWLSQNDDVALFKLDDYTCISQERISSTRGGLMIYLHNSYSYSNLPIYEKSDIWEGQFIKVSGGYTISNIILGNIYRPPRDSIDNYSTFNNQFSQILDKLNTFNAEVIIGGDFNINLLDILKRNIVSDYFNVIISHSFHPHIILPTRISRRSATLIDNFLGRNSEKLTRASSGILIDKFSDHQPYFISIEGDNSYITQPKYITVSNQSPENIKKFKNELISADILGNIDQNPEADPQINYDTMSSIIETKKDKCLPCKNIKFNSRKHKKNSWISHGILKSIKFRNELYKKMRKSDPNTIEYNILSTNLNTYNRILKRSIRIAKRRHYQNIFNIYSGNVKKTWSMINDILHKNKQNTRLPVYFKQGEQKISDKKDIANKFNAFFTNIGKNLADKINDVPHKHFSDYLVSKPNTKFEFQPVEIKEVNKIISQLDSKNSSGYDSISNILIKSIVDIILKPLTVIINQCLKMGIFPNQLKIAKVVPIFKTGDDTLFTNYRPISLLPSTSKVVERVIFNQLYTYFETNKLFYGSQYGFRKRHSTEFAALELVDKLLNMMDKGQVPLGIFLDLSKAFDTLDHKIMIKKLEFYGVSDGPGKLLESYLSNRKQYVVFDDINSQVLDIKTGVPQGSILGPLLFLIYINDIVKSSNLFKFILFADDTTIIAPININNKETANIINMELDKIITWLKLNKLSLNISKTKFCIFHKVQRKISIPEIQIENTVISYSKVIDFLGFRLDDNLNWNDHLEKLSCKLSRTLGIINKLKYVLPRNVLLQLYNSLFLPHVNYGILIWGHNYERIEKLQKRAVRFITQSKYLAHTDPIFIKLNLLKIQDIFKLNQLKFYYKYLTKSLPDYFQNLIFTRQSRYNTRRSDDLTPSKVNHVFATKCISHNIPNVINRLPNEIRDKFLTHSFSGFVLYTRIYFF